jgi:hypothetical protein
MERATRDEWKRRVARWRRSGLTAKEFSAREGLNASTLSFWSWKLGSTVGGRSRNGRRREPGKKEARKARHAEQFGESASPFLGVELMTSANSGGGADLELLLGDVRVRVPPDFDESTLRRVMDAVRGRR